MIKYRRVIVRVSAFRADDVIIQSTEEKEQDGNPVLEVGYYVLYSTGEPMPQPLTQEILTVNAEDIARNISIDFVSTTYKVWS